jgi:hypothetical protein
VDGVIVSLIGIAVVLIAYLCGGFYWAGVVSAKLEQVQQILLKMDGDTTRRLDEFEKDNDLTHKLIWAKHDDLKNRVSVIETRCEGNHKV